MKGSYLMIRHGIESAVHPGKMRCQEKNGAAGVHTCKLQYSFYAVTE